MDDKNKNIQNMWVPAYTRLLVHFNSNLGKMAGTCIHVHVYMHFNNIWVVYVYMY